MFGLSFDTAGPRRDVTREVAPAERVRPTPVPVRETRDGRAADEPLTDDRGSYGDSTAPVAPVNTDADRDRTVTTTRDSRAET